MARRKRVAAYLRRPGRRGYRNGFPGRTAGVVHERIRCAVRTARDNGILQTGAFGPVRLPRLRLLLVPDETQIVKTLSEMMSQPTYIASCSFGKDSIATILLALEHDEPLDRVVFSEVMFDHARNISGEIPEHIGWIYDTAIPKLHDMGIHVDVVRAERDYCYFFRKCRRGGASRGEDLRVPARRQMLHQSGLQNRAHTEISCRNCWRPPACKNENRAVHRYRRRRTASTCKTHRKQNFALGEIRLHRTDGETALRRSRVTVTDLHDRDTRWVLVLPELQNTTFRQPATQSSRTMG